MNKQNPFFTAICVQARLLEYRPMVRSTFLFIFFLLLWSTANAQVSVTATSGTIGPTPYATLGAAFTAINAGTHTGAITVTISGNTTETASASLNASVAPASYTSVTITPSVAAIITGSVTGALIRLNGADNVTIDGRIGGAGRNLSIINTATGGSAAIQLSSTSTTTANTGAINNVIRNLEIACGADQSTGATSTFGILMNGTTISATSNGQDNNNNQFLENRIVKCRYGITTRASTSNLTTGLVISGNIIGPASFGSDEIGKVGIYLQGETGAVISNNTIQYVGGTFATTTGGADRIGIAVGVESWSNSNSTYTSNSYSITNNIIHDVVDERAFSALGILLGTTGGAGVNTDNVVANNFVFGIRANGTGGDQCVGIGVCGGKNDKVVFNSVYLTGLMDPVGTTATSMSVSGIRVGAASSTSFLDLTVKNNICYVDVTSGNAAINHYCISSHSNSFNWGVGGCDYNDYYYPASNTQMKTGGVGSTTVTSTPWTPYATLADWKAVFTPAQDANSKEVLPPFTSATDLHLIPGTATQIESGGVTIAGVTTDIDNNVRSATPDIGADEFAGTAALALDLSVVALIHPTSDMCDAGSSAVTAMVRIKNEGTATLDFAINNATINAVVTGAASANLSASLSSGTLAAGATMDVPLSPTINMTTYGTYNFAVTATTTGDPNAANDVLNASSTVASPVALPQTVDFTGFTGANLVAAFPNWTEASGYMPSGSTSGWSSSTDFTANGTTAFINLDAVSDRAWLIGPKVPVLANSELKFKVAITEFSDITVDPDAMLGTDDSVIVRISTDCGVTFTDLQVFCDATTTGIISNSFVQQTISLAAYAGQNVIIAFFGTEGVVNDAPDYDFHIDDVEIVNTYPNDIGATAMVSPVTTGCFSNAETVTITVQNLGTAILDFTATPVTVTTNVTGAATATLTGTLNTGTLAPGSSTNISMSLPLNMTAYGTYTFAASTSMSGDAQAANDAMADDTRILVTPASLPETVDFTGFTGSNLTTLFSNWREGDGATFPDGTTSSWTSSTSISGSGTTMRINLDAVTDADWFVGPKISVTALSQLKFKIAITNNASAAVDPDGMQGTDDAVKVKVSTDCGVTYSDLHTFNAANTASVSNTLVEQVISLASYAGQDIIIAFFGTEGSVNDAPDYDFHIDDIAIINGLSVDLGATTLVAPATPVCFSNAEAVTVSIKNYGAAPVDFSTNPVTVTTTVTGAVNQVLTGTLNAGTLASQASTNVTMSAPLDMTTIGTYTFNSVAAVSGDGDAGNDAMAADTRTTVAVAAGSITSTPTSYCLTGGTPTLTLAGHAGGNIQWQESSGSTSGPWTNVGTNTSTYTPAAPISGTMYYQAIVSCGSNSATASPVTLSVNTPSVTGTVPDSRCGPGTVTLGAIGSSGTVLNWYAAATGGASLGTGTSFVSPAINVTTQYYVGASNGFSNFDGGKITPDVTAGSTTLQTYATHFTLTQQVTLNSVNVHSGTGTSVTINLYNSAGTSVLETTGAQAVTSGAVSTIPLGWVIAPGTYRLNAAMTGSFIRDGVGSSTTYPIPLSSYGQIDGYSSSIAGTLSTGTAYYFLYKWNISAGCESPRTQVTATVNPLGWTGAVSNDWNDPANWCGGVPTAASDVSIPTGASPMPVLTSSTTVNNLVLDPSAVLALNGQQFTINGTVSGSGTLSGSSASSLVIGGTGALGTLNFDQTTDGTTNVLNNLTLNRTTTGSATLGNKLVVLDALTVTDGTLNTGGFLHLRSTSIPNTARVAPVGAAGAINGDVTVERYIPLGKRAYRQLAPGVNTTTSIFANWQNNGVATPGSGMPITGSTTGANGFDATQTGNVSMFTYTPGATSFSPIANTNATNLSALQGYRVFINGDRNADLTVPLTTAGPGTPNISMNSATTLRATGTLVTGPVTYNTILGNNALEYSLIANPYWSPVDFDGLARTNLEPTYWVWDPSIGNRGAYVNYNITTGTSNLSSAVTKDIQAGQAIFVQTNAPSPSIVFTEANKSASANTAVFRLANQSPSKLYINLFENSLLAANGTSQDGVLAAFRDDFTMAAGTEDAEKFTNTDENIAILNGTNTMATDGRPTVTTNDTVPIRIWQLYDANNYTLRFTAMDFDGNVNGYVYDKLLSQQHPLNMTAATNVPFSFSLNDSSTYYERFIIVFNQVTPLQENAITIKASRRESVVTVDWSITKESAVREYHVERSGDGRSFTAISNLAATANNGGSVAYHYTDQSPLSGKGYYRIKAVNKDNSTVYSSVAAVGAGTGGKMEAGIYPNPVQNHSFTLQLTNIHGGTVNLVLYNAAGQQVYRRSLQAESGSSTTQVDLPATVAAGMYMLVAGIENGERISIPVKIN